MIVKIGNFIAETVKQRMKSQIGKILKIQIVGICILLEILAWVKCKHYDIYNVYDVIIWKTSRITILPWQLLVINAFIPIDMKMSTPCFILVEV